jgi:hypothetical protein
MEGEIEMLDARRITVAFALVLAPILTLGCATAALPPVQDYTPHFTFAAPEGAANPLDMTIAIVRPHDTSGLTKETNVESPIAIAFNDSMTVQFQEILNKKGIKQTGPFDDMNAMTFPDKKGADLALTPEFGIQTSGPKESYTIDGTGTIIEFAWNGPCAASGYVSFVLLEPLSGEKLWVKKIDVPASQVDCTGRASKADRVTFLKGKIAQVLEKVYPAVMKKVWDYMSPEELTLLKKQSIELRAKKVY